VYFFTAIHKLNPEFLSGRTLSNLFFMTQEQGMMTYPAWLAPWLANDGVCIALAWFTVAAEFALVIGLNSRRAVKWFLPLAFGLHTGIGFLMAYIWIFTFQMYFLLIAFLPDRTPDGAYRFVPGSKRVGPRAWLKLCVPGSVVEVRPTGGDDPEWRVETPDGRSLRGFDAWLALLSVSPWTFGVAEVLRIVSNPTPPEGRRSGTPRPR
jgi:hypothetical protein